MATASQLTEIRIKGRGTLVPTLEIDGQRVVVVGKWLRLARVHEEEWQAGQVVRNPRDFIETIRRAQGFRADLFTFSQKLPNTEPRYDYLCELDNLAVIRTNNLEGWWQSLPQVARKNVRRAARRGVVVKVVSLDDSLIEGIAAIYNEIPIRDGRPFPHYGKDVATIRNEVSTLLDRSQFIAAYHGQELIGFVKLVNMGNVSSVLHIVSKRAHYDKRPTNALIAETAKLCSQQGTEYLVYGQYSYGNRTSSLLTDFKRRNGFEQVWVPRYFVPLTAWGSICCKMGLHRGISGVLPSWFVNHVLNMRAKYYERRLSTFLAGRQLQTPSAALDAD